MRVYSTVPIEVTRIGEHLNTIATTIARNPKIEEVTGHDFIVYLTYSYDEKDRLGWIFSTLYGVYEGTQGDCDSEWGHESFALWGEKTPFGFRGAQWFETKEEAVEAQEKYEKEVIAHATALDSTPADANLNDPTKGEWVEWPSRSPNEPATWQKILRWFTG